MASRCLEEERSGRQTRSINARPTKAAATGAGALALAVLAPAGPPQLTVLGHLEQDDKMRLGSTCTSLRQASLAWFPEVTVEVKRGKTDVASLAAWLERHQACLHLNMAGWHDKCTQLATEAQCSDSLVALPSSLVSSLAVCSESGLPAAVSVLTALTRLDFTCVELDGYVVNQAAGNLPWGLDCLRHLGRLKQLRFDAVSIDSNEEELLALPALVGLQALRLVRSSLQAAPRALAGLTQLTTLDLSLNRIPDTAALATLQRLRKLELHGCSLRAVPPQLSALTALTCLDLSGNDAMAGGWQHLQALTHLQHLNLDHCSLRAVPPQLAALAALARLDLSRNRQLAGGLQHLSALTQLRDLTSTGCNITAVPQQLSTLEVLTCLDLSINEPLKWRLAAPAAAHTAASPETVLLRTHFSSRAAVSTKRTHPPGLILQRAAEWRLAAPAAPDPAASLGTVTLRPYSSPTAAVSVTALARQDLSANKLERGWQHLQSLERLQRPQLPTPGMAALRTV
ncbi:hypothetical protein D9Q98_010370 [Chlorella vulgaris]|uniref:Uncharacterized protein n=1 Tax=Chlorella vulgaris TaxID=3077 RepID=A0A9D4TRM2_CHLVU|nr:hypothetical protein D9Q98_010370 [Chlorella vulgaris]